MRDLATLALALLILVPGEAAATDPAQACIARGGFIPQKEFSRCDASGLMEGEGFAGVAGDASWGISATFRRGVPVGPAILFRTPRGFSPVGLNTAWTRCTIEFISETEVAGDIECEESVAMTPNRAKVSFRAIDGFRLDLHGRGAPEIKSSNIVISVVGMMTLRVENGIIVQGRLEGAAAEKQFRMSRLMSFKLPNASLVVEGFPFQRPQDPPPADPKKLSGTGEVSVTAPLYVTLPR